ncbi:hypothetical protein AAHA92_01556 [Salvia divinorum]
MRRPNWCFAYVIRVLVRRAAASGKRLKQSSMQSPARPSRMRLMAQSMNIKSQSSTIRPFKRQAALLFRHLGKLCEHGDVEIRGMGLLAISENTKSILLIVDSATTASSTLLLLSMSQSTTANAADIYPSPQRQNSGSFR